MACAISCLRVASSSAFLDPKAASRPRRSTSILFWIQPSSHLREGGHTHKWTRFWSHLEGGHMHTDGTSFWIQPSSHQEGGGTHMV